jgi:hypothetical protein
VVASFETRPKAAPQDEAEDDPTVKDDLMVRRRTCAVSNHARRKSVFQRLALAAVMAQ